MDESTAEALEVILNQHLDDECDDHQYTTRESMRDALRKAYELGLSARPEVARKYLGTFMGFKVYEDPTLKEGELRLQSDGQLTNEMLDLETQLSELREFVRKAFEAHPNLDIDISALSPLLRSQEKL